MNPIPLQGAGYLGGFNLQGVVFADNVYLYLPFIRAAPYCGARYSGKANKKI